ncbi:hypothetical protein J120_04410 [candidate division TM6 bacterium JCVI TM6SC1]|uniref:Uncharacterized protein n=1 Tax=candidate division TM6 bacterium JCVI TM6SC1 TaxID=1306947 RepID=A0A0D2K3R7_9BACT|nr:hypothetical protein J120_04410 [candidate division TM6 bacterium JCVI TM6SC1]
MKKIIIMSIRGAFLIALIALFQAQGAEHSKLKTIVIAINGAESSEPAVSLPNYASLVMQATQRGQQSYQATSARPLFANTRIFEYGSIDEIPSQTIKNCYNNSSGSSYTVWDASVIHPSITKEIIDKTFDYVKAIQSDQLITIPLEEIVPCCLVSHYFGFDIYASSQFTTAYLTHAKNIDLNIYFNAKTLGTSDPVAIRQYQENFKRIIMHDLPSLDRTTIRCNNLIEIPAVEEDQSPKYILDISAKSLKQVINRLGNLEKAFRLLFDTIRPRIVAIDLSGHIFTTLRLNALKNIFPNLTKVNLTDNKIAAIDDDFLQHLPHNLEVILYNNPITKITDKNHPKSGVTIALSAGVYDKVGIKLQRLLEVSSWRKSLGSNLEHAIKRDRAVRPIVFTAIALSVSGYACIKIYGLACKISAPCTARMIQTLDLNVNQNGEDNLNLLGAMILIRGLIKIAPHLPVPIRNFLNNLLNPVGNGLRNFANWTGQRAENFAIQFEYEWKKSTVTRGERPFIF